MHDFKHKTSREVGPFLDMVDRDSPFQCIWNTTASRSRYLRLYASTTLLRGKTGHGEGWFLKRDPGFWNWRSKGHQGKRLPAISYKPNPRHDGSQHLSEQAADHAIASFHSRNRQLVSLLHAIPDPGR